MMGFLDPRVFPKVSLHASGDFGSFLALLIWAYSFLNAFFLANPRQWKAIQEGQFTAAHLKLGSLCTE